MKEKELIKKFVQVGKQVLYEKRIKINDVKDKEQKLVIKGFIKLKQEVLVKEHVKVDDLVKVKCC